MTRLRDPFDLLEPVEAIARQAGAAILEIYARDDFEVEIKGDDSPLTAADLASQAAIVHGLSRLEPAVPILSEEAAQDAWETRKVWPCFWLVDPLDGTKEFVKRNGEFTVNIALVEDGVPVLGIVYAPVLDRTYAGTVGLGAFRRDRGGVAKPIRASGTGAGDDELVVVASRSHKGPLLASFLDQIPAHSLTSMGSSLKLCLVAEGAADLYPRLAPTMEWDTGAAHAVVSAAGGSVVDTAGHDLRYNKENLLNPHFIVLGTRDVPWRSALSSDR